MGIIFHTLGHVCLHRSLWKLIVCKLLLLLLTDQHMSSTDQRDVLQDGPTVQIVSD